MGDYLSQITLNYFRSYAQVRLDNLQSGLVVLHGANGSGKTNMLEAVSLLTAGRGLRGAKNEDIQNRSAGKRDLQASRAPYQPWSVSARLQHAYGSVQLGTGMDVQTGKRLVRIDGQNARAQNVLSDYLSCVWLTPQMDRLFLDSASHRRKFLDRLIFAFDPGHSGRVLRYEKALQQRAKILRSAAEGGQAPDRAWLTALEGQMAESACAIAAARTSFAARLQTACNQADSDAANPFPLARLQLRGTLEELLNHASALEVEDHFKAQLAASRTYDSRVGGAQNGPHKTDLLVSYAVKQMPAEQCSTGEQKALLIGIIIAHAKLILAQRGTPPLLLLDEVAAHLDEDRRAALYKLLGDLGGQVWLTGTDENLFTAIKNTAQFFRVSDNKIIADKALQGA